MVFVHLKIRERRESCAPSLELWLYNLYDIISLQLHSYGHHANPMMGPSTPVLGKWKSHTYGGVCVPSEILLHTIES